MADSLGRRNRIAAGGLVDAKHGRRRAILPADLLRRLRRQFDARHITDADKRAVRLGTQNDAAEFLDRAEAPLCLDGQLELLVRQRRLSADTADGRLDVLPLQRVDNVIRRHAETGQPFRSHPDAHAVVGRRQQRDVAHAADPFQAINDIDCRVIGEEKLVLLAVF